MNDLDKMSLMAIENMDIRMSGTLVSADIVKQGCHVKMGIDRETGMKLITGDDEYYTALYVINKKQFDALKENKELEELKTKAESYDRLYNKIAQLYDQENPDNDNMDLIDVGEAAATHFGFL